MLGEVIGKGLTYSFVDIELPKVEKPSEFTQKDHVTKMEFLLNKHTKLKYRIKDHMDKFETKVDTTKFQKEWEGYKEEILKLF